MIGQHIVHLIRGIWNGIWSNMGIKPDYMKRGKGTRGLIRKESNTRSVTILANRNQSNSAILTEIESLRIRNK